MPSRALRRVARAAAELITEGPPDVLVCQVSVRLGQPQTRVEALAKELGLSERQFRRRFRTAVGYGPKTLQRVLRFQKFVAYIDAARAEADFAQVALDLGYTDQPHLTRECARLSGLPPAALARIRALRWGRPAAAPLDRRYFGATSKVATNVGWSEANDRRR